jgi:hypothetical protein
MALFQSMQFRDSAAAATSRRAMEMFKSVMGAGHPETFNSLSQLAAYEATLGGFPAATADAMAAYASLQRRVGESHDLTLNAGQRLAFIQLQSGQAHEAGIVARPIGAALRAKRGGLPPSFARLAAVEAGARAAGGDAVGADSMYRAALATLAGGTRVDSMAYPAIVASYGAFLIAHGNAAAAEPLVRRAIAFIPATADPNTRVLAALRAQVGHTRVASATTP